MEIAERNLRYKCSDSIHILYSIVRNLSGIFVNHQKACWFRNSNLASSILDEGSSSDTNYNSELSLQNTFCCYLYAMQAHLSYFYLWNLGAGGINFLQSKQYHRQQKQKGQLGKANSQAVSSMEQHWGVQALAQEILAWLAPQDDQQQKCILKPLWKFSKVVYCHFVYIWISSRKGGVHFSQDIAKNYSNYHFVTCMVNSSPTNQAVWHSIPLTNLWVCGLAELCWYASNFQFTAVYCPWADAFRKSQTPQKS